MLWNRCWSSHSRRTVRLKAWKQSPVTTLLMQLGENFDATVTHMEFLASEVL